MVIVIYYSKLWNEWGKIFLGSLLGSVPCLVSHLSFQLSNMDTTNKWQDFFPHPNCIAFEADGNLIKPFIEDRQLLRKTQKIALNLFTSVSCKIMCILIRFKTASEQKPEDLTWQCKSWWPWKPRTVADCWAVLSLAESQSSKEKEKEVEETFGCWKQWLCFTFIFCSFYYFLFALWITNSDKTPNSRKTFKKTQKSKTF